MSHPNAWSRPRKLVVWKRSGAMCLSACRNGGPSGQQKSGACVEKPSLLPDYDCATPWFMGPGTPPPPARASLAHAAAVSDMRCVWCVMCRVRTQASTRV